MKLSNDQRRGTRDTLHKLRGQKGNGGEKREEKKRERGREERGRRRERKKVGHFKTKRPSWHTSDKNQNVKNPNTTASCVSPSVSGIPTTLSTKVVCMLKNFTSKPIKNRLQTKKFDNLSLFLFVKEAHGFWLCNTKQL